MKWSTNSSHRLVSSPAKQFPFKCGCVRCENVEFEWMSSNSAIGRNLQSTLLRFDLQLANRWVDRIVWHTHRIGNKQVSTFHYLVDCVRCEHFGILRGTSGRTEHPDYSNNVHVCVSPDFIDSYRTQLSRNSHFLVLGVRIDMRRIEGIRR